MRKPSRKTSALGWQLLSAINQVPAGLPAGNLAYLIPWGRMLGRAADRYAHSLKLQAVRSQLQAFERQGIVRADRSVDPIVWKLA